MTHACPLEKPNGKVINISNTVRAMQVNRKLLVDMLDDKIIVVRLDEEDRRLYCSNINCRYGGFKCKNPEVEGILNAE